MSYYHLKPIIPQSFTAQEKKEQRRKRILEAAIERRKEIYKRFYKKKQLQAARNIDTLAEVC